MHPSLRPHRRVASALLALLCLGAAGVWAPTLPKLALEKFTRCRFRSSE